MISLKPISDLLTDAQASRFWIAAYQRGYRWLPLQVTKLLDDVWDFIQASQGRRDESCRIPPAASARRTGKPFGPLANRPTGVYVMPKRQTRSPLLTWPPFAG